ncbi:hypothetical protein GH714_017619 [Hevea brasiliensis]|uniref:Serpin domain-containing protein n=1 Tax=Hevea brasiliensis TaxID=3981 RepID=A0A6A6L6S3_HEVBR|nr:hypothetical protein GH714_017619 [Hevea brasiliensis]
MVIDATPMEKCNRMEFGMRLARHVILKEIKNGCKNNLALSPLSLHAVLNLVASGSTGRILEQLLSFLESESIGDLNAQSSQMMTLVTTSEEFLESENTGDLNYSQSSQTTTEEGSSRSSNELQDNPSVFGFSFHRSPPLAVLDQDHHPYFQARMNRPSVPFLLLIEMQDLPRAAIKGRSHLLLMEFGCIIGKLLSLLSNSYTSKPQFYGSFEGFKILKLPYKSGQDSKRFSMYIFLPDKKDGLQELIQQFNSDSRLLNKRWDLQQVELSKMYIPKWKFSYETDLKKIMKELGLTMIFEKSWELTEVVDRPDLYVSDAIHKSYIEVNEEGTIATAVTAFACAFCGIAAPRLLPPSFVVDHPFMFMIKEEVSEIVLFTGAVLNTL